MTEIKKYHDVGKIDVIGDVHGCYDELIRLIEKELGYHNLGQDLYSHPKGRKLAFVGDLIDRGPKNRKCLEFALRHINESLAYSVTGNHDDKCSRWAKGNPVQVGHGLQKTVDELEDAYDEEGFQDLHEKINDWPLAIEFDDGDLLIAHAAPPPEYFEGSKYPKACLYGITTNKQTSEGFPERFNWVPSYNKKASDDDPYIVYGHVTHAEPYVTDHACCIDTGCFMGNKLSAFRWPQQEVVSVPSDQEYGEDRDLVYHDEKEDQTPVLRNVSSSEITDLYLPNLMEKLRDHEEDILYLIDWDEDLNKREREDGLTIANASKNLYMPEKEHQLYAKGIVYKTNPYELVSLPLVKMYNHGRNEVSDKVSRRLETEDDVRVEFPEKLDGTMIQLFEHNGEVIFTTRSIIEGLDEFEFDDEMIPFIQEARRIAKEKYPILLEPSFVKGKTFIFELIHPDNRLVTDYGDLEELFLLSIWDRQAYAYWSTPIVKDLADKHDLARFDILAETNDFRQGIDDVVDQLEGQDHKPEGGVVCFEKDKEVVHRVKVKTEEYLRYFKLKFKATYKNTVNMIWDQPQLHDWESFRDHLRENNLTEEEVEDFYREHFEKFMEWHEDIKNLRDYVMGIVEHFNDYCEEEPGSPEYFKELALYSKEEHSDVFPLIMTYARSGDLRMDEVMWHRPAHKGFKGEIQKWRREYL